MTPGSSSPHVPEGLRPRPTLHWSFWVLVLGLLASFGGCGAVTFSTVTSINSELDDLFPQKYRKELADRMKDVPDLLRDMVLLTESPVVASHLDSFEVRTKSIKAQFMTRKPAFVLTRVMANKPDLLEKLVRATVTPFIVEFRYTTTEQMDFFMDQAYFGMVGEDTISGIHEAALKFFGKPVEKLDTAEMAVIAGVLDSPKKLSPFTHPEKALARRNEVLKLMAANQMIPAAELNASLARPLATHGR